jgi:hypothetical protein
LGDEDLHLSLTILYALHAYGIEGVDDAWEWDPTLLGFRRGLEGAFESGLRSGVQVSDAPSDPRDVPAWLADLSRRDDGPSLSAYLAREATIDRFREFVIHRSIYTLHEADPYTFAIPRVRGAAKAALVEIQNDEYGGGTPVRMHAILFARTMERLGLHPEPDAYLERVPAATLATVNLVWMLGLHRRLRGAAIGHLAAFEMTSALPNRSYGNGLRRLGYGVEVTAYYDEHVVADSIHDVVAAYDVAGGLAADEPSEVPQIVFGAAALHLVESRFADAVLGAWAAGRSSLRAAPSTSQGRSVP